MSAASPKEYVLGTSSHELERLRLQQEVWSGVLERFLERLELRDGARVLDLGCGPGFALDALRARAGERGEVIGLDESPTWQAAVEQRIAERRWRNVRFVLGRAEELEPDARGFDLIFSRWVFSFVRDPGALIERLARALAPGGTLALQDYNHEGISLFPPSEGFRAIVRATRALYASRGGDAWVAGRLPRFLRAAGFEIRSLDTDVLCGGPGSPAFRWADAFFPYHSAGMVASGVLAPDERERFLAEWAERAADPDSLFFSPIVVSIAAQRAGREPVKES
jgi:SAM-dependent methyltransferase